MVNAHKGERERIIQILTSLRDAGIRPIKPEFANFFKSEMMGEFARWFDNAAALRRGDIRDRPDVTGLSRHLKKGGYGHSITYLKQAMRKLHPTGYFFDDGHTTIFITTKEEGKLPFVIVSPMGANVANQTARIAKLLSERSGEKVIIKKTYSPHREILMGKHEISSYREGDGWHPQYRHNDDTFPEVIWSTGKLSSLRGKEFAKLRTKLNKLYRDHKIEFIPYKKERHFDDAKKLLEEWASSFIKRHKSESREDVIAAHAPFLERPTEYSFLLLVDGKPVGFSALDEMGDKKLGLYASFALTETKGMTEALIVETAKIVGGKGFKYINAGGSERESLHKFKMQFRPKNIIEATHLVCYPPKRTIKRRVRA